MPALWMTASMRPRRLTCSATLRVSAALARSPVTTASARGAARRRLRQASHSAQAAYDFAEAMEILQAAAGAKLDPEMISLMIARQSDLLAIYKAAQNLKPLAH